MKKYQISILIGGIILITVAVIGFRFFRIKWTLDRLPPVMSSESKLSVSELPPITSTSTEQIRQTLEDAFNHGRLIASSTYQIPGSKNELVFAVPSLHNPLFDTKCGLQENPYCGLYLRTATGTQLVIFGPKLAGFQGVERFIDKSHAQILTSWTLYEFTSTDRKQLNLENGELLPLLITETDQDDREATLQVSGYGDVVKLKMTGASVSSRLAPEQIVLQDLNGKTVFTMADQDVGAVQRGLDGDTDRKLKPIEVIPSKQDVETNKLTVNLYGIPFTLDLMKQTLSKG